jgi:hypothetical protein
LPSLGERTHRFDRGGVGEYRGPFARKDAQRTVLVRQNGTPTTQKPVNVTGRGDLKN